MTTHSTTTPSGATPKKETAAMRCRTHLTGTAVRQDNSADRPPSELGTQRALLRVSELAELLGCSRRVVYEWIATRVIPPDVVLRAGKAVYIKRPALEAWLVRDRAGPA